MKERAWILWILTITATLIVIYGTMATQWMYQAEAVPISVPQLEDQPTTARVWRNTMVSLTASWHEPMTPWAGPCKVYRMFENQNSAEIPAVASVRLLSVNDDGSATWERTVWWINQGSAGNPWDSKLIEERQVMTLGHQNPIDRPTAISGDVYDWEEVEP